MARPTAGGFSSFFRNFVFIRLRFPQVTTEHELIKSLISPFNPQNGLADNCSRVPSSSAISRHWSRGRMPDSDWSMMVQPLPGLAVAGFDDEVSLLGTGQTHAPSPFGRLGGIRGAEQSLSSVERYLVQQHTNWNIGMLQACLSESRHNIFLSKDIWCIYDVGTCYIRCICTVLYLRQYDHLYIFVNCNESPFSGPIC